ncbi:MAG: 16S rRNA (guanine(527)-N(7))-methyltransferase RsmG [Deltaproteobacteria bacterium]|jgi:16S rRNA (guanine527-N7)-methyltransferase
MEIGSKEWQDLIIDGARKLGIEIDEAVTAAFSIHASELITWNRKFNLTAITDPREIAIKHFLDSLAPADLISDKARLLDIGSGGGFPGLPLKIFKPTISAILIDGVRKKINFIKHMLRTLGLENIEARQMRPEMLLRDRECVASFDVIISRALSDLSTFVKSALPLLAQRGTIIAMKGEIDAKELDAVCADAAEDQYSLEIEKYGLPSIDSQRSLVIIRHLV